MHDNDRRGMPSGGRKYNCSHFDKDYDEYSFGCYHECCRSSTALEAGDALERCRYRTSKLLRRSANTYQASRSSEVNMPNTSVSTAELVPYIVKEIYKNRGSI